MNRLAAALATLTALTVAACASPGEESASDITAAQLGGTSLYEVDAATALAIIDRADLLGLESFAHGRHVPDGCEPGGESRVSATVTDLGTLYLIETRALCVDGVDGVAERSLVSAYQAADGVAEATWRASFDYAVDPSTRALLLTAVAGERIHFDADADADRPEPTPRRRVVGEGSAEASDCDTALLSASWIAFEQAIGLCGKGTIARPVPEDAEYIAQRIVDHCRMTVIMPYECFDAAGPDWRRPPVISTDIDPTPAPVIDLDAAARFRQPQPDPPTDGADAGDLVYPRVWATAATCDAASSLALHRLHVRADELCGVNDAEQTDAAPEHTVDHNADGCIVHMVGTFACTTPPYVADVPEDR